MSSSVQRFGRVVISTSERKLWVDGTPAGLGARAFDLLTALIERRERVVPKSELLDLAWPGLVVEENNLSVQVSALRKLIGADAIATVAGRGYRFTLVADPEPASSAPAAASESCPALALHDTGDAEAFGHLPPDRTRFIGRQLLLSLLDTQLQDGARMVTLLGTGGVGKTRLACAFARLAADHFPGGAWFCDLSSATDEHALAQAVAGALDVPLGSSAPLPHLGNAITGRGRCLVILDNAEQIVAAVSAALSTWLAAAVDATFLVTSRIRLGLAEEQVITVEPMTADDAAALFVARVASSGGSLGHKDRAAVPRLVEMLDHLPLAIELAAARTRMMSADTMLQRIDDRSRWLANVRPADAGRPLDLKRVFDASWELLPEAERSTLLQLTVFEGGFDLAAAEAVVVVEGDDRWIGDRLQALVDHSLLGFDGRRFRMLRAVWDQVCVREIDSARGAKSARRHWLHFASAQHDGATTPDPEDLGNLVVACGRATAARDVDSAVALLITLGELLLIRGPVHRLLGLAESVLSVVPGDHAIRAQAMRVLGNALYALGQRGEAVDIYTQALRHAELHDDAHTAIRLACALALPLARSGENARARQLLEVAMTAAKRLQDLLRQAIVLNSIGSLDLSESRVGDAIAAFQQGLHLAEMVGHRRWEGGLRGNLGSATYLAGRREEACRHYEATVRIATQIGDRRWAAYASCNLGLVLIELGDLAASERLLRDCVEKAGHIGEMSLEATTACNLGLLMLKVERPSDALEYFEKSASLALRLEDLTLTAQSYCGLGQAFEHLGAPASARPAFESAHRHAVQGSNHLEQASAMCGIGRTLVQMGDRDAARIMLTRARDALENFAGEPPSAVKDQVDTLAHQLAARETQPSQVRVVAGRQPPRAAHPQS